MPRPPQHGIYSLAVLPYIRFIDLQMGCRASKPYLGEPGIAILVDAPCMMHIMVPNQAGVHSSDFRMLLSLKLGSSTVRGLLWFFGAGWGLFRPSSGYGQSWQTEHSTPYVPVRVRIFRSPMACQLSGGCDQSCLIVSCRTPGPCPLKHTDSCDRGTLVAKGFVWHCCRKMSWMILLKS